MKTYTNFIFCFVLVFASCKTKEQNDHGLDKLLDMSGAERNAAIAETQKEMEWAEKNPLTNQQINGMIEKLKTVKFPILIEALHEEIGLKYILTVGRYSSKEEPPYVWLISDNFHPDYVLKYKIKDGDSQYYDFQIIKKNKENSN